MKQQRQQKLTFPHSGEAFTQVSGHFDMGDGIQNRVNVCKNVICVQSGRYAEQWNLNNCYLLAGIQPAVKYDGNNVQLVAVGETKRVVPGSRDSIIVTERQERIGLDCCDLLTPHGANLSLGLNCTEPQWEKLRARSHELLKLFSLCQLCIVRSLLEFIIPQYPKRERGPLVGVP